MPIIMIMIINYIVGFIEANLNKKLLKNNNLK